MTFGSETMRAILGAVAGLLYGCVLAILALGAAGAGHGTLIPLLLSLPGRRRGAWRELALFTMLYGGALVWMVLGWLVALTDRGARLAAGLVVLHYVSGLALVVATGATLRGIAGEIPDFFKIWAPVYLLGQVALWWRISKQTRPTV